MFDYILFTWYIFKTVKAKYLNRIKTCLKQQKLFKIAYIDFKND